MTVDSINLDIEAQNARVTRRQLRGYGRSAYLARRVTQDIQPIARQGSAWVYPPTVERVSRVGDRAGEFAASLCGLQCAEGFRVVCGRIAVLRNG